MTYWRYLGQDEIPLAGIPQADWIDLQHAIESIPEQLKCLRFQATMELPRDHHLGQGLKAKL
ncbi:MAG: hypothetical protein AB2598_15630 [Candidatus Thiodiazotropha sp.]